MSTTPANADVDEILQAIYKHGHMNARWEQLEADAEKMKFWKESLYTALISKKQSLRVLDIQTIGRVNYIDVEAVPLDDIKAFFGMEE